MADELGDPPPSILDDARMLAATGGGPLLQTGIRLIQERMAAIPQGKRRVFVAYWKADGTVGTGVALRIGDSSQWEFVGDLQWRLSQKPEAFIGFSYSS